MNKILLYENRKVGPIAWDASTDELEQRAFSELFKYLDEDWDLFDNLKKMESAVYERAKNGDIAAIRKILIDRKGWEYCNWQLVSLR